MYLVRYRTAGMLIVREEQHLQFQHCVLLPYVRVVFHVLVFLGFPRDTDTHRLGHYSLSSCATSSRARCSCSALNFSSRNPTSHRNIFTELLKFICSNSGTEHVAEGVTKGVVCRYARVWFSIEELVYEVFRF